MRNLTELTKEEQLTVLNNVAEEKGIVENAVEKDYWVSMVLRAIFFVALFQGFCVQRRNKSQQRMGAD